MAASLPLGERAAQASGQPVVGELLDRSPSVRPRAIRAPPSRVREQLVERAPPPRRRRRDAGPRAPSRRAAPPRPPRRCRRRPGARRRPRPRGTRCRTPPARGRPTGCGRAWRRRRRSRRSAGRSSWLTRPTIRTGAPVDSTSRSRRRRSRPPPPMATVRSGWRARSAAAALMRTSMPLRGTSRLRLTTSGPSAGRPKCARAAELAPRRRAGGSARCRRPAAPARWAAPDRRPAPPRRAGSRRRRSRARPLGARGAAPGSSPGSRPGHGDLGAVEHDGVRVPEARARPGRPAARDRAPRASAPISSASASIRRTSDGVGRSTFCFVRTTRNAWSASHAASPVVGRGEHGERRRIEAAPQLPEHGLDPAELGREVVGDEQVGHQSGRGCARRGPRRSVSCSMGGRRSSRPRRRAAQTAWPRSSGSSCVEVAGQQRVDRRVGAVDRRCRARRARCAARSARRAAGCTTARPGRAPRRRRGRAASTRSAHGSSAPVGRLLGRPAVRRAHLLALVAAVDAIAERDPVLDAGTSPPPGAARRGSAARRPHRAR